MASTMHYQATRATNTGDSQDDPVLA